MDRALKAAAAGVLADEVAALTKTRESLQEKCANATEACSYTRSKQGYLEAEAKLLEDDLAMLQVCLYVSPPSLRPSIHPSPPARSVSLSLSAERVCAR